MTTEADLQAMLDADPADWQTRLILADFLQDRDDPRAAGYRALGELQLRPLTFLMKSGEKSRVWGFHCGIGIDPSTGKTASFRHALPRPWFDQARTCEADIWVLSGPARRACEDRVAHSFANLSAERQAGILASGRSRLRCAAAMGV